LKTTTALFTAAALSLATLSGAAFAQAANVKAGATVYDPQGGTVGTVDKVDGDNVVLKTEKGPVSLTRKYFALNNGALTALVTKDQVLSALSAAQKS